MSYECDLRRLFKPPIDHLPLSEQLTYYRQRDLVPSHLYRVGTRLFGSSGIGARHRVTDTSFHSPSKGVCHEILLQRSLDGKEASLPSHYGMHTGSAGIKGHQQQFRAIRKSRSEPSVSHLGFENSDFSEPQYRKWLSDRRTLREGLDSLGANEKWLCSKERTPLESSLLRKIRNKPRKSITTTVSDLSLPEVSMHNIVYYHDIRPTYIEHSFSLV